MRCGLCGGASGRTVSSIDAKCGRPLQVVLCNDCGLVQQDPLPSEEDLAAYYRDHYRVDYKGTYAPKLKHVYRAGLVALDRCDFMNKFGVVGGTLLDIGAGGGEFVYLSRCRGFRSVGVEPNVGYAEFAQSRYNVDVTIGDHRKVFRSFQVVTMFHVLEHLADPVRVFEALGAIVEDGGTLVVEVPNIEARNSSPRNIYFKAHVFYFSPATLIACASPYFEPVHVDEGGNLRVIFRKRPRPVSLRLPEKEAVARSMRRFQVKGWMEYLFLGRGLLRPLEKLEQLIVESRLPRVPPKALLEGLLQQAASVKLQARSLEHRTDGL